MFRLGLPGTVGVSAILCAFFGLCLTLHLLWMPGHPYLLQPLASAIKVPCVVAGGCAAALAVLTAAGLPARSRHLHARRLLRPAVGCLLSTSLVLAALGPAMAAIAWLGNYSVLLFSVYAAFAVAGMAGCWSFGRTLAATGHPTRPALVLVTVAWASMFALSAGDIGWNIRPIVGWTGQPFTWLRPTNGAMWLQLRCEGENLRRGGAPLPERPADFRPEDWPC